MSNTVDGINDDNLNFGNLTITGTLTANAVVLPTLGAPAPTQINYYEEYNYSTTFNGAGITTSPVAVSFTRVGRAVTCTVDQVAFTAVSAGTLTSTTIIPLRFRPSASSADQHFTVTVFSSSTRLLADASINNLNQMVLTASPAGGNSATGSALVYKFSTPWSTSALF